MGDGNIFRGGCFQGRDWMARHLRILSVCRILLSYFEKWLECKRFYRVKFWQMFVSFGSKVESRCFEIAIRQMSLFEKEVSAMDLSFFSMHTNKKGIRIGLSQKVLSRPLY